MQIKPLCVALCVCLCFCVCEGCFHLRGSFYVTTQYVAANKKEKVKRKEELKELVVEDQAAIFIFM